MRKNFPQTLGRPVYGPRSVGPISEQSARCIGPVIWAGGLKRGASISPHSFHNLWWRARPKSCGGGRSLSLSLSAGVDEQSRAEKRREELALPRSTNSHGRPRHFHIWDPSPPPHPRRRVPSSAHLPLGPAAPRRRRHLSPSTPIFLGHPVLLCLWYDLFTIKTPKQKPKQRKNAMELNGWWILQR